MGRGRPWIFLAALALVGCKKEEPELLRNLPNEPGGNPLVPDVALFPWPSDLYLVDDPSTRTGRRLELPDEALPEKVVAADYAQHDGFTRAPHILASFDVGIDPASLPTLVGSVDTASSVLLVRSDTQDLVPIVAEVDARAQPGVAWPAAALDAAADEHGAVRWVVEELRPRRRRPWVLVLARAKLRCQDDDMVDDELAVA